MKLTLPAMLALSAIGLFTSCAKIIDFEKHHPGADEHYCNIEKLYITSNGLPGGSGEFDISYNAKGNPIQIKPLSPPPIAYITRMKYDNKDRLIGYRLDAIYSPTDSIIIYDHHYSYTANGRSMVDSNYQLPSPPPPGLIVTPPYDKLTLDAEGRIIKDSSFTGSLNGAPALLDNILDYNYNAKGNLASVIDEFFPSQNASYTLYDDKVNWRQTNKVWQLIERNYSQNNALDPGGSYQITEYDPFGLPLEITTTNGGVFLPGSPYGYQVLDFQYACDVPVIYGK